MHLVNALSHDSKPSYVAFMYPNALTHASKPSSIVFMYLVKALLHDLKASSIVTCDDEEVLSAQSLWVT